MKTIIILLFVLVGLQSIGQMNNKYLITGFTYDGMDMSNTIYNNGSTIQIDGRDAQVPWLKIKNNGSQNTFQGLLTYDDVPDKEIERSQTQYKSQSIWRRFSYIVLHEYNNKSESAVNGYVSIILVYKPNGNFIDCTLHSSDGHAYVYSGYQINQ